MVVHSKKNESLEFNGKQKGGAANRFLLTLVVVLLLLAVVIIISLISIEKIDELRAQLNIVIQELNTAQKDNQKIIYAPSPPPAPNEVCESQTNIAEQLRVAENNLLVIKVALKIKHKLNDSIDFKKDILSLIEYKIKQADILGTFLNGDYNNLVTPQDMVSMINKVQTKYSGEMGEDSSNKILQFASQVVSVKRKGNSEIQVKLNDLKEAIECDKLEHGINLLNSLNITKKDKEVIFKALEARTSLIRILNSIIYDLVRDD